MSANYFNAPLNQISSNFGTALICRSYFFKVTNRIGFFDSVRLKWVASESPAESADSICPDLVSVDVDVIAAPTQAPWTR